MSTPTPTDERIALLAFACGMLIVGVLASSCTFVKIEQGHGAGDIFIDTPYKSRAAISDGDQKADQSGTIEGTKPTLELPSPGG